MLLLATQLRSLGLRPVTTDNAAEALKLFEDALSGARFDAVITDCNMPATGGCDLAVELIERSRRVSSSSAPIVGYSADASDECLRQCQAAGMVGRLVKPVSIAALHAHLLGTSHIQSKPQTSPSSPRIGAVLVRHDDSSDESILEEGAAARAAIQPQLTAVQYIAGNDPATARELLELLLGSIEESRPRLVRALQTRQNAAIAQQAHHILGAAKMLGFEALAEACQVLGKTRIHSRSDAEAAQAAFMAALAQAETQLRLMLHTLGAPPSPPPADPEPSTRP